MEFNRFIGISTLLFSLSNPVGVIPIFLGLTNRLETGQRVRVIAIAAAAVACLLSASAFFGQDILAFFNIGLDDFRIAGGLLALFIAFEMFQAHYGGIMQTSEERSEAAHEVHGIAITPLAFPLLVGPAEMSIVITLATERPTLHDKLLLAAVAGLVAAMIALTLLCATPIDKLIGKTGINVVTRIMALFVAAIGVNFIMTGLRGELPGLLH